jgi:hypothetical protein
MNYFLSNLFRDKLLWLVLGLSALAGLNIMDMLTFMLMPVPVFNLWVVKITAAAAVVGTIAYGSFLYLRGNKVRNLDAQLPDFLVERRAFLARRSEADREFQTFCHECRHFDLGRLRCLLVLRERKAWIKLYDDSPIRYCLYWNLEDRHPVMRLTERVKKEMREIQGGPDEILHVKEESASDK